MHERDTLAVNVARLAAFAQHACAFAGDGRGGRHELIHVEGEMVYAAGRVMFQELGDRGIGTGGLHQLDACVGELDVSEAYALLLVHQRLAEDEPVEILQALRGRLQARHGDRNVAQSDDHASSSLKFQVASFKLPTSDVRFAELKT